MNQELNVEVNYKVKEISKYLTGMKSFVKNRYLGMNAMQRLYGVTVPTVWYGAKIWNTKEAECNLNVFDEMFQKYMLQERAVRKIEMSQITSKRNCQTGHVKQLVWACSKNEHGKAKK